jgi:phospho-N-acetylmuramoyl-pentapeptide-transferase
VFKWRKRRYGIEYARAHRLLRRAPLHHALEEAGMPETRIVARFWLVAALSAALAVAWCRHLVGQG